MRSRLIIFVLLILPFSSVAEDLSLTAICKDPTGRMLGKHGVLGKGAVIDEKDSMTGGLVSIVWQGGREGQIITQGSGGGSPLRDKGYVVFFTDEQVSFLVVYPKAVWLYSLYPKLGLLLMSRHNNGMAIDSGGAIGNVMRANCDVSVN